jgi:GT2 family glycosyltransferase
MPMVSLILLSWNRKADILLTLESLRHQSYDDFEIIVVDQGSTDGTLEAIAPYPIHIVKLHKNFGIPGGRNIGAAKAKGDLLVFLCNDAELEVDALEIVVNRFQQDENLGIIGFKILNAFTKELDILSWPYQKSRLHEHNKEFETYTFCGTGHAIRKRIFYEAGTYWDELFFGWEEMDLSIRVMDAGYKIVYDPRIVAYHRRSAENRTSKAQHDCQRLKNSLWVLWRYFPLAYAVQESCLRVGAYFIKAMKQGCFLMMLRNFIIALKKIGLLFDTKDKISHATLEQYLRLSYKGGIAAQLRYLWKS